MALQQEEKMMLVVDGLGARHIIPDNKRNRENIAVMNQFAKRPEQVKTIHAYDPNNPNAPLSKTTGPTKAVEQLAVKNAELEKQNADLLARLAELEAASANKAASKTTGKGEAKKGGDA